MAYVNLPQIGLVIFVTGLLIAWIVLLAFSHLVAYRLGKQAAERRRFRRDRVRTFHVPKR